MTRDDVAMLAWLFEVHVADLPHQPDEVRLQLCRALDKVVRNAVDVASRSGFDIATYRTKPQGDGLQVLIPSQQGCHPQKLITYMLSALKDEFDAYTVFASEAYQLNARVGLAHGMVTCQGERWIGRFVDDLQALLGAGSIGTLQKRLEPGSFVFVVSEHVHQMVLTGYRSTGLHRYSRLETLADAERACVGWVTVVGSEEAPVLDAQPDQRLLPRTTPATVATGHLPIGSGRQGVVYALPDIVDLSSAGNRPLAYKEYHPGVLRDLSVLEDMTRFLDGLAPAERAFPDSRLAWPLALAERDGSVSGYVMQRIPPAFYLDSPGFDAPRPQGLEFLLNGPAYLAKVGLRVDDQQRLLLLKDLASVIDWLHAHDITVGDLSPRNILFTLDVWPLCLFAACDSMSFRGRSALAQVEIPYWDTPDEVKATRATDVYKFGLLAARLFTGDQESRDTDAVRQVSSRLGELAERSLSNSPDDRPPASLWSTTLDDLVQQRQMKRSRRVVVDRV